MSMTVDISNLQTAATESIGRKKFVVMSALLALTAYFIYVFFAFDIIGLSKRASLDNAKILVSDSYSYKVHVARDNRSGDVSVKIEGETKGAYPEGESPEWVQLGEKTVINLGDGHVVTFGEKDVTYFVPGFGEIWAQPTRSGVETEIPEGDFPGTINQSKNRLAITTDAGRLSVTRNRTEVLRYFGGWNCSSLRSTAHITVFRLENLLVAVLPAKRPRFFMIFGTTVCGVTKTLHGQSVKRS